jgi:tetratricopeptide (TPR) repeat protein
VNPQPLSLTVPQAMERAISAYQSGQFAEAARLCDAVLRADPRHLDAINMAGALALQRGDMAGALAHFSRAVEVAPDFAQGFNNRGVALQQMRRWDEALASFEHASALEPAFVDALYNRGVVLSELKRWDEALQSYARALELDPKNARVHNNRGNVLQKMKRWNDALASYQRALELRPDYSEALTNRGAVLRELRRWDEAMRDYRHALALRPEYPEALSNLGLALKEVNRWEDALRHCDRALQARPGFPEAANNRGFVLHDLRRWDEALASYQAAIDARPDYAEPRWNMSLLHLLRGDYARGWDLFEWRWKTEDIAPQFRAFPQPLWLGKEDIAGRNVLVHSEQGLGDTIQYARYVHDVVARGAKVVFETPAVLQPLMASSFPEARVVTRNTPGVEFELQVPLASLPLAFGTTVETIPTRVPYLAVDDARQRQWNERLGPRGKRRIGLAWAGNPAQRNDHNRSMPFRHMAPLLEMDFEFHCLQKDLRATDGEVLARFPQMRRWDGELRDFADTAALANALDLVISVDTSIAHLAGALGRPTWILLTWMADYRYLLDREDSPWYPSARLFRQETPGGWDAVVDRVRAALAEAPK